MDEHDLVNVWGLAEALQLPRRWLIDEALAGHIPCLHIGKKLRFSVTAVRDALAECAANSRIDKKYEAMQ